jgi:hypothetical protein
MPPHARAGPVERGHRFAADMERPLSSLSMLGRFRFVTHQSAVGVYGDPPGGSESAVKAGRFDDESL